MANSKIFVPSSEKTPSNLVPRIRSNTLTAPVYLRHLVFLGSDRADAKDDEVDANGWKHIDPFKRDTRIADQPDGPVLGVLLTYEQTWMECGIALGRPLKSTTLAPGEVTRFAITGFGRTASGRNQTHLDANDAVSAGNDQNSAVLETQKGVSQDMQKGGSYHIDAATQESVGYSSSSILTGVSANESASTSMGATQAQSSDENVISLEGAKKANQHTAARSNAVRSQNCGQVRDLAEHEVQNAATRVVANYNHMHAMTVMIFEVVERYKIRTAPVSAERVIFIPMPALEKLGDAKDANTIAFVREHFDAIASVLAARNIADPQHLLDTYLDYHASKDLKPDALLRDARLQVASIASKAGLTLGADDKIFAGGDVVSEWKKAMHEQFDANKEFTYYEEVKNEGGWNTFGSWVHTNTTRTEKTNTSKKKKFEDAKKFLEDIDAAVQRLDSLQHQKDDAEAHKVHIDRPITLINRYIDDVRASILGQLDAQDIQALLKGRRFAGEKLDLCVDPHSVGVHGSYMAFRFSFSRTEEAAEFRSKYLKGQIPQEIEIDLGSGATFGEAILGEAVSAEKIDLTRFWNWKDSMIPILPPDIDATSMASRARDMTFDQAAFQETITEILKPHMAEGADLSGLTSRIGDKARDMSGMDGMNQRALALTQAVHQSGTEAASQATHAMQMTQDFAKAVLNSPMPKAALFAAFPELGGATFAGGLMGEGIAAAGDDTITDAAEALDGSGAKMFSGTGELPAESSGGSEEVMLGGVANAMENASSIAAQTAAVQTGVTPNPMQASNTVRTEHAAVHDPAQHTEIRSRGGASVLPGAAAGPTAPAPHSILNEQLRVVDLSDDERKAFRVEGGIKLTPMPAGTLLYRYHQTEQFGQRVPSWWSEVDDNDLDGGLIQRMSFGLKEFSRIVAAVSEDWNSFNFFLIAKLSKPVYAFRGKAAGQARLNKDDAGVDKSSLLVSQFERKGSTKKLVGNAGQLLIKNMTGDHIVLLKSFDTQVSDENTVNAEIRSFLNSLA